MSSARGSNRYGKPSLRPRGLSETQLEEVKAYRRIELVLEEQEFCLPGAAGRAQRWCRRHAASSRPWSGAPVRAGVCPERKEDLM
jgi:hypothetical protein